MSTTYSYEYAILKCGELEKETLSLMMLCQELQKDLMTSELINNTLMIENKKLRSH